MEDKEFIQIFLYSFVILICFLLSVIFLTSLSNVKSQYQLNHLDILGGHDSYNNSYIAISVLFTFCFFGFIVYMTILMIIVKQYKINKIDKERFRKIWRKAGISEKPTDKNKKVNSQGIKINYYTENVQSFTLSRYEFNTGNLVRIMMFLFIYVQVIYFIEIITLSVYHSKAADFEKNEKDLDLDLDYFTRIYSDLIIVGYIFLFLFILFDLFTFIFVRNQPEKKRSVGENERYCEFFSECLTSCCDKMANVFSGCERDEVKEKDELEDYGKKLDERIQDLEKYLTNLTNLNQKLEKGRKVVKNEIEKLNIPTSDESMETDMYDIETLV